MRTRVLSLALALASTNPAAATLYRCEATGVADPLSTGSLSERDNSSQIMLDAGYAVTFDAESGLLRTAVGKFGQSSPLRFSIVYPGSKENDLVAFYQGTCFASCPFSVLKIRVWEHSMPFVYLTASGSVWSGRCSK